MDGEDLDHVWQESIDDANDTSHCKGFRVIIHVDIDCFYAQVETIKNPTLKGKKVGVQQKNLVITTNYVARAAGLPKTGFVKDMRTQYPDLVLVNGEDLQDYRKFSQRIFEALSGYGCPVERLGMDENFLDVTLLVQAKLKKMSKELPQVCGHTFNDIEPVNDKVEDHMLSVGSNLAKEMRELLKREIGVTSSAGIAENKMLAKLVGSTHKPDDQTTLWHGRALDLMNSLEGVRGIPGIGSSTCKSLKNADVCSVADLQNASDYTLLQHFDNETAKKLKELSFGVDNSEVKMSGRAQSIGLEDRFKQISNAAECRQKMAWLLGRLASLISDDGRLPQTLKVTARDLNKARQQGSKFMKESRQCKVSPSLFRTLRNATSLVPSEEEAILGMAMKLLEKMIDLKRSDLHLTLLGLSVSDFITEESGSRSIKTFFQNPPAPKKRTESSCDSPSSVKKSKHEDEGQVSNDIPPDWDKEVFLSLPKQIQDELIRDSRTGAGHGVVGSVDPVQQSRSNSILQYFTKKKA